VSTKDVVIIRIRVKTFYQGKLIDAPTIIGYNRTERITDVELSDQWRDVIDLREESIGFTVVDTFELSDHASAIETYVKSLGLSDYVDEAFGRVEVGRLLSLLKEWATDPDENPKLVMRWSIINQHQIIFINERMAHLE
jgi:hypothetical protein